MWEPARGTLFFAFIATERISRHPVNGATVTSVVAEPNGSVSVTWPTNTGLPQRIDLESVADIQQLARILGIASAHPERLTLAFPVTSLRLTLTYVLTGS